MDRADLFAGLDAAIATASAQEHAGLVVAIGARLAVLGAAMAEGTQLAQPVPDENVDVEEGARRLGVSVRYVYRNAKTLPVVRIGRRLLLSSRGIDEFIRKRAGR